MMLIKAIGKVEAKEMLNAAVVANFPNLESDDKKKFIASLEKQAEIASPFKAKKVKDVSNKDLDSWLRSILG